MKNVENIYPLSPMQQGMLFHTLYEPEADAYLVQLTRRLQGQLCVPTFKTAWQFVIDRHAVLRTSFVWKNLDEPLQIVRKQASLPWEQIDLRACSSAEQEQQVEHYLRADRERAFVLSNAPLMRLSLLQLADDSYEFICTYHHILLDGWAISQVFAEVFTAYAALDQGRQPSFDAAYSFCDYIGWLQNQDMPAAEQFWRQLLQGFTAPTRLSVMIPDAATAGQRSDYHDLKLQFSPSVTAAFKEFAARHKLTINTLVQGAWALLLSCYSGEQDVLFGATVAGRPAELPGAESMVGLFINTLPVRVRVTEQETTVGWLKRLQEQQVEQRQYEYSPLVAIQAWSEVPRGQPLFENLFVFENYPVDNSFESQTGLTIAPLRNIERTHYPLTLIAELGTGLKLSISYDRLRFDDRTINHMLGHLDTLLQGMVQNPKKPAAELPLLTGAERRQLLELWNTFEPETTAECIHRVFEKQVEQTPQRVAVCFQEGRLTYAELDARANQLANYLVARGAGPEKLVGVCLERSLDLVVALLGILKSGAAYVPLDPAYPPERLALVSKDAGLSMLLTQECLKGSLAGTTGELICLDSAGDQIARESDQTPAAVVSSENPAYVIYTSGSTGSPKGVVVTHQNVVRLMRTTTPQFNFGADDVWTLFHSYAFDFSVWEIWGALFFGGRIVVVPYLISRSPKEFYELLCREAVTVLNQTPSAFRQLIQAEKAGSDNTRLSLRTVIFGGEALEFQSLKPWFDRHGDASPRLVNMYGITETTVHVTYRPLMAADIERSSGSQVGRPLHDLQVYILDRRGQLVPIGVAGEMYVGGGGVARGYLGRPELTAERFVPHPFSAEPGARLYRTGDLARYREDGDIEYLGRIDRQVKIRGFRIELAEIETLLVQHQAVSECIVLAREDGAERQLIAYVVPESGQVLATTELRAFLKEKLPEFMLPTAFVHLKELPLTPNNKVNLRALPAPVRSRADLHDAFVPPRNAAEELLAGIWATVLKVPQVGVHDNFFELGGHSLLATQVMSRVHDTFQVELPLRMLFELPSVAKLSEALERSRSSVAGPMPPAVTPASREARRLKRRMSLVTPDEEGIPLDFVGPEVLVSPASFAQERLWFLDQWEPESARYNVPIIHLIKGNLQIGALSRALDEIVARHETLRSTFIVVEGQLRQVAAETASVSMAAVDLADLPQVDRDARAQRLMQEEADRPFELARGPLLRATLLRLAEDEHILLLTLHHIVSDGWSLGVLFGELSTLYEAFSNGQVCSLPALPIQYSDYTAWQRQWLRNEVLEDRLSFWRNELAGAPDLLELPTDRPRRAQPSYRTDRHISRLSAELTNSLRELSRREGVTLFMTLLAAFQTLLHRYSGRDDLVVGTPIANRNRAETEGLIGLFVNMLALRTDLSGQPTFRDLLWRVRERALDAYAYQDLPFEKLVEDLRPVRSVSHNAVFQVMFALQNAIQQPMQLAGLHISELGLTSTLSDLDLSLEVIEESAGLRVELAYSTDLFNAETIDRMAGHFVMLLRGVVANPQERISTIPLLTSAERQQLLVDWSEPGTDYDRAACMHQLFETQAESNPEAVAVVFENQRLTYRELNERANQMAHYLRKRQAGPEVRFGVHLERSAEMVVTLLAVLKAGAAYVPLDPLNPAERIKFILEDSGVPVLLTQKKLIGSLPELRAEIIQVDEEWPRIAQESTENLASGVSSENLAYVIYTSGSTGRPKGVGVTHQSVIHLFKATHKRLRFREGDVWSVVHSSSFDFSVWEMWGCLLQGGQLVVIPLEVVHSPPELFDLVVRERVTILSQTPTALRQLLAARRQAAPAADSNWSVRLIVCGGDTLDNELALELHQLGIPAWNFYGPTESTVWTTCTLIEPDHDGLELTSIGCSIPGLETYVVDQHLQPMPIGIPGELLIGGEGLARGYVNRPALTAEKFIPSPFHQRPGVRLYKTGDLARYHRNGKLEFLGRLDYQVKFRGFRVELGEIEMALSRHPQVSQAVVLVREDRPGDQRLVAYTVLEGEEVPSAKNLRDFLQPSLPDYMVPSAFVTLDALPLTANGKLDRRALPIPDYTLVDAKDHSTVPRTAVEEMLATIWASILNVKEVGPHDNFFEMGGHSLLAMQLTSRVREAFQVELPLRSLFESPTVAPLAEKIERSMHARRGLESPPLLPVGRDCNLPLSFAQQRLWFLDQLEPGSPFYNIPQTIRLRGSLNRDALQAALNEIMRRHGSLRTCFYSENGTPLQRVEDGESVPLSVVDLMDFPEIARTSEALRLASEEARRPFDLTSDPLLRAGLYRIHDDEHVLVLVVHHIAADAWSLSILIRELATFYESFAGGKHLLLPELPIQYSDFAVWQRDWLKGEVLETQLSYWRKQLAGAPLVLNLPPDRPRPATQSFHGAREPFALPAELSASLKELSRREGVTLFMCCLAAFELLLSRSTGKSDFLVGTDVANRNRVEVEGLIGFFTNLLSLRARLQGNPEFTELLRRVREVTLEAYAHQDLPFEKLVEELKPERDLSRNPIVQVLLVMQNGPGKRLQIPGLEIEPFDLPTETSRFDLVLFLWEAENALAGMWLYDSDLFEPRTIARMSRQFEQLLAGIVTNPTARLDSYQLQTDEEAKQVLLEKSRRRASQIDRLRTTRRKGVDLRLVSR